MIVERHGGMLVPILTPLECYSAMVARVMRGDLEGARKYARALLKAHAIGTRPEWFANAIAILEIETETEPEPVPEPEKGD